MWSEMSIIRILTKEILGESKGIASQGKFLGEWGGRKNNCSNERILKNRGKIKIEGNCSKYNLPKKEAKKAVSEAKFNAYESLYKKLDTKEGCIYIYIYIVVQAREEEQGLR